LNQGINLDVLTALREATARQHAELDARTPLAAPAADLAAYRDHLLLLEAWLAPIQAWLDGCDGGPRLAGDYLALVRRDLAHPALAAMERGTPLAAAPWPPHAGAAFRWGVCYVVEGSQLGGAVLYKRLAGRLAPHPLDYLRGETSPGPRWQRFITGLRATVTDDGPVEQACRGARQAFDSIIALNRSSAQPAGHP
jgi:heme oxygenase